MAAYKRLAGCVLPAGLAALGRPGGSPCGCRLVVLVGVRFDAAGLAALACAGVLGVVVVGACCGRCGACRRRCARRGGVLFVWASRCAVRGSSRGPSRRKLWACRHDPSAWRGKCGRVVCVSRSAAERARTHHHRHPRWRHRLRQHPMTQRRRRAHRHARHDAARRHADLDGPTCSTRPRQGPDTRSRMQHSDTHHRRTDDAGCGEGRDGLGGGSGPYRGKSRPNPAQSNKLSRVFPAVAAT